MPEYFAIVVVVAGLLVIGAVLLMHTLNKITSKVEAGNAVIAEKLDALSEKVAALETGMNDHGRDLDAIRSEFALHITTNDGSGADYQQAIKAASSGHSSEEVMKTYGLREAEAQLLVAVYGNR